MELRCGLGILLYEREISVVLILRSRRGTENLT
jgi:hypothetical protein